MQNWKKLPISELRKNKIKNTHSKIKYHIIEIMENVKKNYASYYGNKIHGIEELEVFKTIRENIYRMSKNC